jgi:hypothetical protein
MYLTNCGHCVERGGKNKSQGAIAIAYKFTDDGVRFGVAFCSPKDRYRKYSVVNKNGDLEVGGRDLAEQRLVEKPKNIAFSGFGSQKLLRDFIRSSIVTLEECPSWARDSYRVKNWARLGY